MINFEKSLPSFPVKAHEARHFSGGGGGGGVRAFETIPKFFPLL